MFIASFGKLFGENPCKIGTLWLIPHGGLEVLKVEKSHRASPAGIIGL